MKKSTPKSSNKAVSSQKLERTEKRLAPKKLAQVTGGWGQNLGCGI